MLARSVGLNQQCLSFENANITHVLGELTREELKQYSIAVEEAHIIFPCVLSKCPSVSRLEDAKQASPGLIHDAVNVVRCAVESHHDESSSSRDSPTNIAKGSGEVVEAFKESLR